MSKANICRNCIHWKSVAQHPQHGKCSVTPPFGELQFENEICPDVYVFPMVREDDRCSAFSPIPALVETSNVGKCVNRIIGMFDYWYCDKGLGSPMPAWRFNRKLKSFSPNVLTAAKTFLINQGRLESTPVNNNGKTGLSYSLKPSSENN